MEFEILYAIQKLHTPFGDWFMPMVSSLGNVGIFWIMLSAAFLAFKKTRKCGVLILFSMLLCFIAGNMFLKNWVARPRPCWLEPSVPLLIPMPEDFSFPSGHTMHGFAAATAIFLHFRKAGVMAFILAAVIAFSRMYLFVHFPTDILAGLIIGTGIALLVYLGAAKMSRKREMRDSRG